MRYKNGNQNNIEETCLKYTSDFFIISLCNNSYWKQIKKLD